MYTIKQASLRSGVSIALLRQWERRYGVVRPGRTASGYRTYDDAAIDRMRAMRRLVDEGWSPNAAAAEVIQRDQDAIRALLPGEESDRPTRSSSGTDGMDLVGAFVEASAVLDAATIERVLDEMFAQGTFEQVADTLVLPALRALGDAWATGRVDVAAEHAASHAVLRRLSAAYQAAGRPSRGSPSVLVGLPPGARHELGALTFAVAARRAGIGVQYLGADLPVRDWLEASRQTKAAAVVIGVVGRADLEAAVEVRDTLEAAEPSLLVAVGGREAGAMEGFGRSFVLPEGLLDAVDALRSALEERAR